MTNAWLRAGLHLKLKKQLKLFYFGTRFLLFRSVFRCRSLSVYGYGCGVDGVEIIMGT
jgi:hypothetical protein